MYLIGCVYNFCVVHDEVSSSRHVGSSTTPAMAAGLADRVWNVKEGLTFQEVPAPWVAPKRRGRPPKEQTAVRKQISARLDFNHQALFSDLDVLDAHPFWQRKQRCSSIMDSLLRENTV
jgi:hypothetical protein